MILEEISALIQTGSPLLLLSAGLLIGFSHAFEPDHLAAISTQVSKVKNEKEKDKSKTSKMTINTLRNSLLGVFWGLGHTSMILFVSALVFLFSLSIPMQIFDGFELGVGLMLVALGGLVYLNKDITRHSHPHIHANGVLHSHPHYHGSGHKHNHKSYLIGCIHGLAGSGALIAISLSTLSDVQTIFSFALIFGVGSIGGMTLVSGIIGIPFSILENSKKIQKVLRFVTGTISIIIGFDILYGISSSGFLNLI